MDLNRLKTFKILAETLSYTETAKRVFITQSAVSQQMKQLQDEYGARLVQKLNNNLVLTPEGRTLYSETKSALDTLESTFKAKQKDEEKRPVLRIAGVQNYLSTVLIPKLDQSKFLYQIDFRNATESNDGLLSGKNDIVFTSRPLSERLAETVEVFEEELILVGVPELREYIKKKRELPLVDMHEGLGLYHQWEKLNGVVIPCELVAKVTHLQGLYEYVKSHPVACLLPKHMVAKDLKEKRLISLLPKQTGCKNQVYASILKIQKSELIWDFFRGL